MPSERSSPYAGRWVARVGDRIVGHGGTPEQARSMAQYSRPKEVPEIEFMPFSPPLTFSPLLETIREITAGQEIYLVGGAVRDALMGRVSHDLDFIVPKHGLEIGRALAHRLQAAFFPLDAERDTARLVLTLEGRRHVVDIAGFRAATLEEDLEDRDFTINAMAFDIHGARLYDPLQGAQDVREKRLRLCRPDALERDPLRVLRAIRLAAQLGFQIVPEMRPSLRRAAPLLVRVSAERQRDELFRILEGRQVATALRALDWLGLIDLLFPELPPLKTTPQSSPHIYDVWAHTLALLQHLENILDLLAEEHDEERAADLLNGLLVLRLGRYRHVFRTRMEERLVPERARRGLLFFAALYHDVAKPLTSQKGEDGRFRFWDHEIHALPLVEGRAQALCLSREESEYVQTVVRQHMRIHHQTQAYQRRGQLPSRRTVYRFFRDSGDAGIDLTLLALADLRATYGHTLTQQIWSAALDVCRYLLEQRLEHAKEAVHPPRLLDGNELMQALGLTPGPQIGELLEAIREAQACGEVRDREEALEFARKYLQERREGRA
ncbi:MAG: HD domain-containing protein [Anaerolineales bacterium]